MDIEPKFTDGPWKLARKNPGLTTGLIGPTPDKRLGTIHTGSFEYVANAHLIAAAPELFEALEDLISDARKQMANPSHHMPYSLIKAEAAIAKALAVPPGE